MYANLNPGMLGIQASLPETIGFAQQYGFKGIDFSVQEAMALANQNGFDHVVRLFENAGVIPSVWGFGADYRRDDNTWRTWLNQLPKQAEFAQRLGANRTSTWILPGDDERDFLANFRFHTERLRPAAQILSDYGCRLGLEFVGPRTLRKTNKHVFIHTLEGMLALAAAIGTGNVGLLLDAFHLYTSHGSANDVRELKNADVVVVHVNDALAGVPVDEQIDNIRTLPGETGAINIVDFLHALHGIGYDGPLTAEPFSQRVRDLAPQTALAETATAIKKVMEQAGLSSPVAAG
jgi:sugar phosphate isomerase/epimerase